MKINKLTIALSSALFISSFSSHADSLNIQPSSGDTIEAPFSYAKSVFDEESLDMQAKLQHISDYVKKMPNDNFTRLVNAVGTDRFIPKQTIFMAKHTKTNKIVANLSQQQRLDKAMNSQAASKQLKSVLTQYLYAYASRPVYAGLSGGMLAGRIPTPSK